MAHNRTLLAAVLFGLLPPVFCGGMVIAVHLSQLFYVGSFLQAFTFITAGAVLVGTPPMAVSGYLLAKLADERRPSIRLAFTIGCAASLVTALGWSIVGWLSFNMLVYLGVGLLGGLATVLFAAMLFRPSPQLAV